MTRCVAYRKGHVVESQFRRSLVLVLLFGGWIVCAQSELQCTLTGTAWAAPFVAKRDAHCVAYSPDGKLVAIGYSGQSNQQFPPGPHPNPRKCGVVQWFDVASGRRLQRRETFGDITRVAFSPDGQFVAAARLYTTLDGIALNEVRVWLVATGNVEYVFDRCQAFDFSPTSDEILVTSRRRCVSYHLSDGAKLETIDPLAGAISICCSPNGQQVAAVVALPDGFCIRAVSRASGAKPVESQRSDTPFYTVAFSPDGNQLASGHAGGLIWLWDARTLTTTGRLQVGGGGLQYPFYSPDGELIASGDQQNSDVVFWNRRNGQELRRYTFQQGSLHAFHVRSGERPVAPEKSPHRFAFSPDGEAFLAGPYGGIIRLVSTGQDVKHFGE